MSDPIPGFDETGVIVGELSAHFRDTPFGPFIVVNGPTLIDPAEYTLGDWPRDSDTLREAIRYTREKIVDVQADNLRATMFGGAVAA